MNSLIDEEPSSKSKQPPALAPVSKKKAAPVLEAEQAAEEMAANEAFEGLDTAALKIQSVQRGRMERRQHRERVAKKADAAK